MRKSSVLDQQGGHDVALPMPVTSGVSSASSRTSGWLCMLTTSLAFLLGVGVGVAVPFYLYLPVASSGAPLNSTHAPVAPAAALRMPESSFVYNASRSAAYQEAVAHYSNAVDDQVAAGRVTFVESSADAADVVQVVGLGPSAPPSGQPVSGEAVSGVFWTQAVEDLLPSGFDDQAAEQWRQFTRRKPVVRLEDGCGRMQNRLVTFENGTKSCCRYRQNYDQIQGEIFSFYLSRLLDLPNLPPSALGLVRPLDDQWNGVRSQLSLAQWAEERPVVFTQFLQHLEPAYIPAEFRGVGPTTGRQLHPPQVSSRSLQVPQQRHELLTLAQWSDLIVFDYLTANLDRMVNNLYNMQWNPQMMDSPAHNLARDTRTGLLVFLDNESGLLHGYRLLDKYEVYHKSLLDSLCVFRRSTVAALKSLQSKRDAGDRLRRLFDTHDAALTDFLPFLPDKSVKTLNHRIDRVLDQVQKCQSLYASV